MKKIFIIALAALFVLAGCQSGGNGTADYEKDFTFIVGQQTAPQSFHPNRISDDGAWPVNQNIFNRLLKLNAFNEFVPDLAEKYEFSDDGLTLTFNLKEGVKWHDGEAFSSADVKYTYDTIIAEKFSHASSLSTVDSIDTPDENTVVFNLKNADSSILAKLSWYGTFIMPKHIYEGTDQATNPANQKPIGTGPFKFVEYQKDVAVTLERNDDFFGNKSNVKKLVFQIIPDENTLYQAFLNGEVDYMGALPAGNVNDLDGDANYNVIESLGINRTYVTFNLSNEHFSKPEVRKAVAYAIDQKSVFDRVGGAGVQSSTLISPVFEQYINNDYLLPETNVEKAIQTLEDAGYTKNANGYYIEANFDYFTSGNFGDIATIIAANLEKAGIKLNLNAMEISAWQKKVMDDYDFELTMLAGYQGPDIAGIDGRVKSDGTTNIAKYNNPELDEILKKAVQVSEVSERKVYYDQVQQILAEDLPMIFILDNGYKTPVRKEFEGTPYQDKTVAASEFTNVKKTGGK